MIEDYSRFPHDLLLCSLCLGRRRHLVEERIGLSGLAQVLASGGHRGDDSECDEGQVEVHDDL
jgi:hypothetical protein